MQVQEIKDVASLGIGIANLLDKVAGGVSIADVFSVVGILREVKPAVDAVKSGLLFGEYEALDAAAKADLISWFDSQFQIKEANVKAVVDQATLRGPLSKYALITTDVAMKRETAIMRTNKFYKFSSSGSSKLKCLL